MEQQLTSVQAMKAFTLSVGATGSSIDGGAGNDTFVVLTGSNLQTASTMFGGVGNDLVSVTGDLSGGYVLGGDGRLRDHRWCSQQRGTSLC